MISYELQLRYVILDKIQSESVRDKIFEKKKLLEKNLLEKNSQIFSHTKFCLRFPVHFLSCLRQIDAYHH